MMAVTLAGLTLTACAPQEERVDLLENAPVVAKRVTIDGETLIDMDPSLLSGDTIYMPLSHFTEELEIIPLDNRDEALVGRTAVEVSDHHILTYSSQNEPFKLFDREGNFLTNIGAIGQGPGEYQSIYTAELDETTRRVYLFPFFGKEILVYDFEGNVCPSIPLAHEGLVGLFALRGDTVVLFGSPQPKRFPSCVWLQDREGNLLYEFPTERLDFDFRGVTVTSNMNIPGRIDLSFWIPEARLDTLYEISIEKGVLIPRFTATFKGDMLKPHMYGEFPDYFVGEAQGQWTQSRTGDDGQTEVRVVGDPPAYYIVDKRTLRGSYYWILNDFLGGERTRHPMALTNGNFSECVDPGDLMETIERALQSGRLTPEWEKKLTALQETISENDNNYVLYARLKPASASSTPDN